MSQLLRVMCFNVTRDGFGAGVDQSLDHPFGHGANPADLFSWAGATASWVNRTEPGGSRGLDDYITRDMTRNIGAEIMGRNKFGPQRGPWENHDWKGWWGDTPPFHTPVFVLTHHEREPLPLQGGTTFTFVTGGIESALEQARAAAGDWDVMIAGGASAVQQYLAAGLLDELYLHVVPVLLGAGERLLEGVGDPKLEPVKVVASPAATHVKYRVVRT